MLKSLRAGYQKQKYKLEWPYVVFRLCQDPEQDDTSEISYSLLRMFKGSGSLASIA